MANKMEDAAYLIAVDLHIEDLAERIEALGEQIAVMKLGRYDMSTQAIWLSNMLELRKDMDRFRAELLEEFNAKYGDF